MKVTGTMEAQLADCGPPRRRRPNRLWAAHPTLALAAGAAMVAILVGCGYQGAAPQAGSGGDAESSITATTNVLPSYDKEMVVPAPDLATKPEEVVHEDWGTGPGEVSLGQAFESAKGGPDLAAVSPDGKTIAVYDQYADPPRVNLYAGGAPVGAASLKPHPDAMALNNNSEIFALYQGRPSARILHLAASGDVLESIPIAGSLDPLSLLWVGSSLYIFAGVGGSEEAGYVEVVQDGAPLSGVADSGSAKAGIEKGFPSGSGQVTVAKDPTGGFLLSFSGGASISTKVHLTLPTALAEAAAGLYGDTSDGLPVIMLFKSLPDHGGSLEQFVAVDLTNNQIKAATVQMDWKVPGGGVVVGSDAMYVVRLDLQTGMDVLRVPFK
jgi:hypothetical protein